MSKPDPNAPIMNLDDFFGGGITLAQYERKDDPEVQSSRKEAEPMNFDLIDMNNFLGEEPDENDEGAGSNLLDSQQFST